MLALHDLQTRFFHSIAKSPGTGSASFDPAVVACVEGHGSLGADERINIYAQMYCARLVEVLQGDFSRVANVLGCERFHAVAAAYLAQHPSTHPSLRHLGRDFPTFLHAQAVVQDWPFLSDLATLEWTRLTAFDAQESAPLRVEHLQDIAPEAWPTLRLRTSPALQVAQYDWPVHEIWHAAGEDCDTWSDFQPEPTVVRVWREEFSVYHAKIDMPEKTALECIQAGAPFAEVCAALEAMLPPEEAAATIGSLLLRWIEDGILAQLPEVADLVRCNR